MTTDRDDKLAGLTRPIIGIENRTAQEVFDIMCDRILRALPASGGEGVVAVKPLEWHGDMASSIIGIYRLETFEHGVVWGLDGIRHNHIRPSENAIEAKAAAQAHYEQRIRSALTRSQP